MSETATLLPARRPELLMRPLGDQGRYVLKDPRTGAFFELGAEEHFLLTQLDGKQDAAAVCQAFAERFDRPLNEDELDDFLEMARQENFLHATEESSVPGAIDDTSPRQPQPAEDRQSLLCWR